MDRRFFLMAAVATPLYAGPLVLFSLDESKLVEAICNQVIPADDAPGAVQAGVVFYIDKQLAGPLKRYQPAYQRSIPLFRSACRERTGSDFAALRFSGQTEFLRHIEPGENPELATFFAMVVDHTMQGFYGSPQHGGNAGQASWKMLSIVDEMEGHRH